MNPDFMEHQGGHHLFAGVCHLLVEQSVCRP